jgi:hypothetical protein
VNLSSYNSDFLSGLFADVAKVNVLSELRIQKRGSEVMTDTGSNADESAPMTAKRSRLSLNRSHMKSRASFMNLGVLQDGAASPKGIIDLFGATTPSTGDSPSGSKSFQEIGRQDSLAFQLNCVSSTVSHGTEAMHASSGGRAKMVDVETVFPHLPTTVSDSSCATGGLTRCKLGRQVSNPEINGVDSFGWFVDLDGESNATVRDNQANLILSESSYDLAFQAPTVPKGVSDEAELEWAKAADTVDDVLGDFF